MNISLDNNLVFVVTGCRLHHFEWMCVGPLQTRESIYGAVMMACEAAWLTAGHLELWENIVDERRKT